MMVLENLEKMEGRLWRVDNGMLRMLEKMEEIKVKLE